MKKYLHCILIVALSFFAPAVFAGKVDVVRSVLKKECKKNVSYEEALVYVRVLYLTCIPDTVVHIEEVCSTKCLKANTTVTANR